MQYVIYLRKSRADAEAEQRGEGETLARHEKALIELAKRQKLNVIKIYKEVVSGETIVARPVMQQLLSEVEQAVWDGVLVMEIERLARGDTIDQGIMAQAFKFSGTKIITPSKTYDPNNEFDEEYFEFGLFMSRREYKTINRRLQRGRIASVKEGKYVGNRPPYGYLRKKLEHDKGYTLDPHPEQADVIRMIFEWYTKGDLQTDGTYKRLGMSLIVRKLNNLGIKPQKNDVWTLPSIRDMLLNPVYIGKIRWNSRPSVKQVTDGVVTKSRPRSEDVILVDGLHDAIIDSDVFETAQYNMSKNPSRPVGEKGIIKNPLSGIVVCGKCGRKMVRKPYGAKNKVDTLMCPATACNNVSSALFYVEDRILKSLDNYLNEHKIKWKTDKKKSKSNKQIELAEKAIKNYEDELSTLNKQLDNLHNLLEQGVYDTNTFLDRSKILSDRVQDIKNSMNELSSNLSLIQSNDDNQINIIPKIEHILEVYDELPNAQKKNDLLKEVINKVTYTKDISSRWHGSPDDFDIILYPKIK